MVRTGNYRRLSERAYQALLANPDLCEPVVCLPDDLEAAPAGTGTPPGLATEGRRAAAFLRATGELLTRGLAAAAAQVKADSVRMASQAGFPLAELGPRLNIDETWRELQLILTGNERAPTASPGDVVLGGSEIGPDLGHGRARLMLNSDVRATAAALERVTRDSWRASCGTRAREQDGDGGSSGVDERVCNHLFGVFGQVRDYFRETARLGWGMLLWLS